MKMKNLKVFYKNVLRWDTTKIKEILHISKFKKKYHQIKDTTESHNETDNNGRLIMSEICINYFYISFKSSRKIWLHLTYFW